MTHDAEAAANACYHAPLHYPDETTTMATLRTARRYVRGAFNKSLWAMTGQRRDNILVAAAPKTGSTYVTQALREVTGFRGVQLSEYQQHTEYDLDPGIMAQNLAMAPGTVSHNHARGTSNNVELIRKHNIKTVVLVRDIHDIVASLADHFHKQGEAALLSLFMHKEALGLSREDLIDYIVYMCVPWYLGFVMSWREAAEQVPVCWMTYERFFSDQPKAIAEILDELAVPYAKADFDKALEVMTGKFTRLNKGVSGRGGQLLSEQQKQAIRKQASVWKFGQNQMKLLGIDL